MTLFRCTPVRYLLKGVNMPAGRVAVSSVKSDASIRKHVISSLEDQLFLRVNIEQV